MEFSSIISELQDRKVDMAVRRMNVTPQLKKAVELLSRTTRSSPSLVKKADADKFNTIADTKGACLRGQDDRPPETIAKQNQGKLGSLVAGTTRPKSGELWSGSLAKKVAEDDTYHPDTTPSPRLRSRHRHP
ncbi:hypothetical protein ACW18Z_02485 [Limosilactobacillus fermentum]